MAGRGRGISKAAESKTCEPLRRPGTKTTPSTNNEDSLDERLRNLQLGDFSDTKAPPSISIVAQNIKDQVTSEADVKLMASTVIQFGVRGGQHASIVSQLVQELRRFNFEDSKFLVEFLNELQIYFEAENFSELPKYLGYLRLLCETYYHLGHEGNNPLSFLKDFILGLLQKLLTSGSHQEISIFVQLALRLCTNFTENEWNSLMRSVRTCIISSKISEKSRSSLLQLFELYLRNWKSLNKDVNEVYNSYH